MINLVVNFFKKYKIEILSIIIPIILFFIPMALNKIYPTGKNFIAAYDASVQYPGFTNYFMNVLKGNESLFYSFKGLLGYNFYATAIYYLFNPTNLLSVFFSSNSLAEYYTFIVLLRIGLSGFTMSKLLKYKENKGIFTVIFSVAYALMSYNVLYFFNFMYFDVIVLFPLVIMGLEKLIYQRKKTMYLITLSLSIISNFYIGYMVCIFSLIYFIYKFILLEKKDRDKKIIKDFVIISLLACLISAFVLLPIVFEVMSGKINVFADNQFTKYWEFGWDVIDVFYRATIGAFQRRDISYGPPNIYCSLLVITLVITFFFNKNISKKEKIVTLSVILFFLLCFSFNLFDYAWHMFQRPIWYPNRYSFTFSFFLILIAYKNFRNIEGLNINFWQKILCVSAFVVLVFLSVIIEGNFNENIRFMLVGLSILCILQYLFGIRHKLFIIFCGILFVIEITTNSVMALKNIAFSNTRNFFYVEKNSFEKSVNAIKELEAENKQIYRMEFSNRLNYNNGATFLYNGINYFSSLRNGRIMTFFDKYMGYRVADNASMVYDYYNPIMNAILGVKYMSGSSNEHYYEKTDTTNYIMYKNNDALSIGFMVNDDIYNVLLNEKEYYPNTQRIVNGMLNSNEELFLTFDTYKINKAFLAEANGTKKIMNANGEDANVIMHGTIKEDGFMILKKELKNYLSPHIFINGEEVVNYNSSSTLPLFLKKGDKYEIECVNGGYEYLEDYLRLYFVKYDTYKSFATEMKKNELVILEHDKDDYIKGKINSTKDKNILFTTIPYDEGWKVFVDGKKTEYREALNSFISLELSEGEHIIEFRYIPRGFVIGTVISLFGLVGAVLYLKKYNTQK